MKQINPVLIFCYFCIKAKVIKKEKSNLFKGLDSSFVRMTTQQAMTETSIKTDLGVICVKKKVNFFQAKTSTSKDKNSFCPKSRPKDETSLGNLTKWFDERSDSILSEEIFFF